MENSDLIVRIEKHKTNFSLPESSPKLKAENYVDKCMEENKTMIEILTELKELFNLSNSHAAELYKKRLWEKINEYEKKSNE